MFNRDNNALFGVYDRGKLIEVLYAADLKDALKKAAERYRAKKILKDEIYLENNIYQVMRVV